MATDIDFTKGQSGGPVYGEWSGNDGTMRGHYVVGVMTTLSDGKQPYNEASGGPALSALVARAMREQYLKS